MDYILFKDFYIFSFILFLTFIQNNLNIYKFSHSNNLIIINIIKTPLYIIPEVKIINKIPVIPPKVNTNKKIIMILGYKDKDAVALVKFKFKVEEDNQLYILFTDKLTWRC